MVNVWSMYGQCMVNLCLFYGHCMVNVCGDGGALGWRLGGWVGVAGAQVAVLSTNVCPIHGHCVHNMWSVWGRV